MYFGEDAIADMVSEVTSFHEIEDEVELVSVLEGIVHVDDEGGVEVTQEDSFVHNTLDTFFGHDS